MLIYKWALIVLTVTIFTTKAYALAGFDSHKIYGDWVMTVKTDGMTDKVMKSAISINRSDKMNTRILIVECHADGELAVFLSTDRFVNLQNKPVNVMYRFAGEEPISQTWNITSNDATSIINTAPKAEIKKLVNDLSSKSGNIKLRYEDGDGTDYDVVFSLKGSTSALEAAVANCN